MLKVKTNIRLQIRGRQQREACCRHPVLTFLWVLPILCLLVWRFKNSSGWRFNICHLCKFPTRLHRVSDMNPLYKGTPRPRPRHAEILIEDGACDTWALSHRIKRALLSLPSKFTFIPLITLQFAPVVTSPVGRSGHTGGQDVASAFCHWPFATFRYGASSPFTGFLKVTISSYFQGKWKSNLFCFDVKCKSCHGYDLLLCTLSYSMQK